VFEQFLKDLYLVLWYLPKFKSLEKLILWAGVFMLNLKALEKKNTLKTNELFLPKNRAKNYLIIQTKLKTKNQ
jgi:hypothetical protein